jgi:glutathione peroxidase
MKKIILMLVAMMALTATAKTKIYKITVKDGEGQEVKMKQYKGKVLLIVNTATRCGFTPQYTELENIYEKYHGQGLEILDFPCNQFGQQAPGTNAEIHNFCTANFNIQFEQFDKIDVNGPEASPLFTFLKSQQGFSGFDTNDRRGKAMHEMMLKRDKDYAQKSDIKWNFTKFLVDRKGRVVKRFEPTDKMEDVEQWIQKYL